MILCRFIVENFVFEKHVRYILTIYPVVIVALSGNLTKNFNAANPSRNGIYIGKQERNAAHHNGYFALLCVPVFYDTDCIL